MKTINKTVEKLRQEAAKQRLESRKNKALGRIPTLVSKIQYGDHMNGRLLRELRLKASLTQTELGNLLESTQFQVSTWENGHRKINKIKEIAIYAVLYNSISPVAWLEEGYLRGPKNLI